LHVVRAAIAAVLRRGKVSDERRVGARRDGRWEASDATAGWAWEERRWRYYAGGKVSDE
jgi:hypothetical protein